MKLQHVPCPLCGTLRSRKWGEENGFTAVKCADCGLVYVNPRPTVEEIAEATAMGQHQVNGGMLDVVFSRDPPKIEKYRGVIGELFADRFRRPLSWLDVGAGFGEVVEAVSSLATKDSRVEGIEPMVKKVDAAQQAGVLVTARLLSDVSDRYDVISIINVFSHLPDVRRFLDDVKRRLTPGGELLLETGNGGDLSNASLYPDPLYLPDHLVFAGVGHMQRFLGEAGFSIVMIRKNRRPGDFVTHAKSTVKRVLAGELPRQIPFRSPFRTVFYRVRLGS